jgi:hypothetical protein
MPVLKNLTRGLTRGLTRDLTKPLYGLQAIVYKLRLALNASNAAPLTALDGTVTQVATGSVTIPVYTTGTTPVLQTFSANTPVIEGARYTDGSWYDTDASANNLYTSKSVLASGLTAYRGGYASNPHLGTMVEQASTNKITSHKAAPYKVAPTATVTGGGSTPATLTLAADTTELTSAGIRGVATGNVFKLDNSAGNAPATVTFGGTTANTNKHSLSVWARKASGAGSSSFALTSGTGSTAISAATYSRLKSENLTPSGTTQQFVITAGIGDVLWFILPCLEEQIVATSEIYATPETTAAVTRPARYLTSGALGNKGRLTFSTKELGREQYLLDDGTRSLRVTSANDLVLRDTSQVMGSELITNGTFATNDLTGWTKGETAIVSAATGSAVIQRNNQGSAFDVLYQTLASSPAGKSYSYSFTVSALDYAVSLYVGGAQIKVTTTGTHTGVVVGGTTNERIVIAPTDNVFATCTVDNISVKEVAEVFIPAATAALVAGTPAEIGWDVDGTTWELTKDSVSLGTAAAPGSATFSAPIYVGSSTTGTLVFNGTMSGLISSSDAQFDHTKVN